MTKGKFGDLTGRRFGALTVIERGEDYIDPTGHRTPRWLCRCDCGGQSLVQGGVLRLKTRSCKDCCNPVHDRVGRKYGQLLVVKRANDYTFPGGQTQSQWLCKCDCGNETVVQVSNLNRVKSCGCSHTGAQAARILPQGGAARNKILAAYKQGARRRELSWELGDEEFHQLTTGNCYYCGVVPSSVKRSFTNGEDVFYNGIDRVDNSLGYTSSNTVSCCRTCNTAKSFLSLKDFLIWVNKVALMHPLEEL